MTAATFGLYYGPVAEEIQKGLTPAWVQRPVDHLTWLEPSSPTPPVGSVEQ